MSKELEEAKERSKMNEIAIGEYVRTHNGYIRQVEDYCDCKLNHLVLDKDINGDVYLDREDVVKHSKNIIDLVKIDDYVNGYKIIAILRNKVNQKKLIDAGRKLFNNNNIKSIITKEQFKAIEYKV